MIGSGRPVRHGDMKLVNRRSTDSMIYRTRRMPRLEIRPSGRTPRVLFHLQRDGGGVEQDLLTRAHLLKIGERPNPRSERVSDPDCRCALESYVLAERTRGRPWRWRLREGPWLQKLIVLHVFVDGGNWALYSCIC